MTPSRQGSIHLFRLWGISVYLHWSWFFVAYYAISARVPKYGSPVWGVLEYLALFLIVLMHEFGHSLACRRVGGQADQIVLWPLGGVAYVNAPPRPGATLWSIAAGPLVNVALLPVLLGLLYVDHLAGWRESLPDLHVFLWAVGFINGLLLGFNLLPVYPLDGGQILRSLLWYALGKGRSLMVATGIGFAGGLGFVALAVWGRELWMGILSLFLLVNCWRSFQEARALRRLEHLPRRREYACPVCETSPPIGPFWLCQHCGQPCDLFAHGAVCPQCQGHHEAVACPDCGRAKPLLAWDPAIPEG